ncbi:MAG: isocitrate/isopropylmalate dehydrogenase family protein [bacterium]|nr:isocitrate/isopropylmalate dehydrogenase family protein [bacterium]
MYTVTLIPGDGIGPEITEAMVDVLSATGVKIEFEKVLAGESAVEKGETPLPALVLDSIRKNKVAIKGPLTTPVGFGFRSVNVALRQELNLYAGVRPAVSFPGSPTKYENIDLVMIRENTEGLYSGIEHFIDQDKTIGESIRVISRKGSERIVKFAFEYALSHNRKKVTCIHKANILKVTCGLFLQVAREIAKGYPQITFEDKIVDNMAMQLVKNPQEYDVLVTTNLFGDVLSDLCAGLIGGLGLAPSANIGEEIAVFEPVHGSAPKYAGQDKVNPCACILSGAMMLEHLGEKEAGKRIVKAVADVIKEGKTLTYDLGGTAKTSEITRAIIQKIIG